MSPTEEERIKALMDHELLTLEEIKALIRDAVSIALSHERRRILDEITRLKAYVELQEPESVYEAEKRKAYLKALSDVLEVL